MIATLPTRLSSGRKSHWYFPTFGLVGITDSPSDPSDAETVARHHAYLARMVTEGVVPADVSAKARTVWELARKAVPGLPVPLAVAHDGGPIHYTWDNDRQVIALECLSGKQPCEWYVSDRATRFSDGGEFDLACGLPEQVVAMCQEYLRHLQPRSGDVD